MRFASVLSAAALSLALSGCSFLGFGEDANPTPKSTPKKQVAEVDKVIKALKPLTGDKDSVPSTKKFFTTMMDAGYEADQLEATIDESPLGNDVPSKMFGVKTDRGCVVGEIRGGKASAELLPPTESTGSCLFGEVERPKGVTAPKGEKRDDDGDSNGAGHLPGEDINGKDGPTESPSSTDGSSSSEGSSSSQSSSPDSSGGGTSEDSSSDGSSSQGDNSSEGSDSSGGSAEGSSSDDAPSLGGG